MNYESTINRQSQRPRDYWDRLKAVCEPSKEYWRATAAQRAEAFLRTLNLWDDNI